ncbi:MAG: DUF4401 domain-containing protein [Desulfobacterales bacterium]|nr:DUF4401 domain-containing protein [Desulfobacterales bacterium]
MNENAPTMGELLAHPRVQGFVSPGEAAKIAERLAEHDGAPKDPLYIRVLSGMGAWFAAACFIVFLVISELLENNVDALIVGSLLLGAGIIVSRASKATFPGQLSLALAFAGNTLVLFGAASLFNQDAMAGAFAAQAVVCIVVYPLHLNAVYRFLAPTALAVLAAAWILEEEAFVLMHLLMAAETLLAGVGMFRKRPPAWFAPLARSAAVMAPATILFMNLLEMDMWGPGYNEPAWPSSLLLAGAMIYLYIHLAGGWKRLGEPWMVLAVASTILLGVFTTPGVLVAIGLLVAGYGFGDRFLMGVSLLFLPCFLVLFYYALNIDLAHKSWVITGSGALLLAARGVAGRFAHGEATQ